MTPKPHIDIDKLMEVLNRYPVDPEWVKRYEEAEKKFEEDAKLRKADTEFMNRVYNV